MYASRSLVYGPAGNVCYLVAGSGNGSGCPAAVFVGADMPAGIPASRTGGLGVNHDETVALRREARGPTEPRSRDDARCAEGRPVPSCRTPPAGRTIRSLAAMWTSQTVGQTHHVNRGRAGFAVMTGKTDVSIIASESPAIGAVEPVDAARSAIIPAAVFIIVEIILVAETISVILLKEFDPRNPGAAPIAVLLSIALLANLGLVCSIAAASVAKSIPRSEYEEGPPLSGWSAAAGLSGDGIEPAPSDGHARHAR